MVKNKGITLVALVVTIVVLLILAGVSINLVLGENGLIKNAKEAREQTKSAEVNEKTQMDSASDFISEAVNSTELPQTNETKPYMPGDGFTKVDGTNLANGLTIQDSNGNQYVWVEVPMTEEVYPIAKLGITEFNDEAYTKIENDLHTYTMTYRKGKNTTETSYKDEWYEDADNKDDWYTQEQYLAQKQKMLKSVYQNGGFWIGRYEAGIEENRNASGDAIIAPQSKQNLYPYTYITRTQAKNLAEMIKYTKNTTTYTGSLMFGVQWDLMLKFIETKKIDTDTEIISKLNVDSTEIGNYRDSVFTINRGKYTTLTKWAFNRTWNLYNTPRENYVDSNSKKLPQNSEGNGTLLTTGAVDQNYIMNICDIAGNVWEWTLEHAVNELNAVRGGNYNTHCAASNRSNNSTSGNNEGLGFRICLY